MELSAHQMSFDPFGVRALHTRHPQDMELVSRVNYSSRPVFSISPSSPPRHAHRREMLGQEGSTRSSCHSSEPISEATSDVRPCPELHGPFGVGGQPSSTPAKRARAVDDVDGPETANLSVKKRRLLLRLVTSRLSHPFSLPATNILIRESSDNMPVLHRIQHCVGARRAGHQSALIRKAAILNRVRIGVRTAAISRGHVVMADLTARDSALNHGLLLVTTPAPAVFPAGATATKGIGNGSGNGNENGASPPAWRPHTTSFHPPIFHQQHYPQQNNSSPSLDVANRVDPLYTDAYRDDGHMRDATLTQMWMNPHKKETSPDQGRPLPTPRPSPSTPSPAEAGEEDDNTAFPSASFRDRYADLSDDDMDDVYADFGVLFGSGTHSPEARGGGSPAEEQFLEEYLDELDGIPWVM